MDSDEICLPVECLAKAVKTLGLPQECLNSDVSVAATNKLAFVLAAAALTARQNFPRLTAYGWAQVFTTLDNVKSGAEYNASEAKDAATTYAELVAPGCFQGALFSNEDFEDDFERTDRACFDDLTSGQFLSLVCAHNNIGDVNISDKSALREKLSKVFDIPVECVFSDDPVASDLWDLIWIEKLTDTTYRAHFDYNNVHMATLDIYLFADVKLYASHLETEEDRPLIEPSLDLWSYLFDIALPHVLDAVENAKP